MCDSESILRIYHNVVNRDILNYQMSEKDIICGIKIMKNVYQPKLLSSTTNELADYNYAAHRVAYLHKYATFHTIMVRELLLKAILRNFRQFYDAVFSSKVFKICSLGGGPGSDVIGLLSAFHTAFSHFNSSACVVDYMYNWSYSFNSVIQELCSGMYGSFGFSLNPNFFDWKYLAADLLKPITFDVYDAISSASIITMVKFISAAACLDTERMIESIFDAMKPGSMLLFIDNAAGGFHEIILRAASKYNFDTVFGPLKHEVYTNSLTKVHRFGYNSCCSSTITFHILQKPVVYDPYVCLMPYPPVTPENVSSFESPKRVVIPNSSGSTIVIHNDLLQENRDPLDNYVDFKHVPSPISSPYRRSEQSKRRRIHSPKIKKWHTSLTSKMNKIKKKAKSFIKSKIQTVKKNHLR